MKIDVRCRKSDFELISKIINSAHTNHELTPVVTPGILKNSVRYFTTVDAADYLWHGTINELRVHASNKFDTLERKLLDRIAQRIEYKESLNHAEDTPTTPETHCASEPEATETVLSTEAFGKLEYVLEQSNEPTELMKEIMSIEPTVCDEPVGIPDMPYDDSHLADEVCTSQGEVISCSSEDKEPIAVDDLTEAELLVNNFKLAEGMIQRRINKMLEWFHDAGVGIDFTISNQSLMTCPYSNTSLERLHATVKAASTSPITPITIMNIGYVDGALAAKNMKV